MSEKSKKNQTIQYYDQNAADFVENTRNVDFHVMQDEFIEGLPAGAKILDLGCGSGRDTKYFLEHGYRVDAIDGSAELCALASEYTGIQVKCQLFQELDASEVYDGIWACSSLLHLSYGELDEVLYRIEKALKPQGILYMSFKYGVFEGESEDLKPMHKEDYEDFFFPYGGEKLSQVSERMLKTCIEIMERENHNEVLALSHGVACRCFLSNFEDVDEVLKEGIPNCIIFKYEYEDKQFKLIDIIRHDFSQIEEVLA